MTETIDATRAVLRLTTDDGGEYALTRAHGWVYTPKGGVPEQSFLADVLASCGHSASDHEVQDKANRRRWQAIDATEDLVHALVDDIVRQPADSDPDALRVLHRLIAELADGNRLMDVRMQADFLGIQPQSVRVYYDFNRIAKPVQYLSRAPLQTLDALTRWNQQRRGRGWAAGQRRPDDREE